MILFIKSITKLLFIQIFGLMHIIKANQNVKLVIIRAYKYV